MSLPLDFCIHHESRVAVLEIKRPRLHVRHRVGQRHMCPWRFLWSESGKSGKRQYCNKCGISECQWWFVCELPLDTTDLVLSIFNDFNSEYESKPCSPNFQQVPQLLGPDLSLLLCRDSLKSLQYDNMDKSTFHGNVSWELNCSDHTLGWAFITCPTILVHNGD